MAKAIPDGLTREHVLLALEDLDNGIDHPFAAPTGYELVHAGKRYPPKAVIGVAFRHLNGNILDPRAFAGGEGSGRANYVLRNLGFTIEARQPTSVPHPSQDDDYIDPLREIAEKVLDEGYFEPKSLEDERSRRLRTIVQRQGQPAFRAKLITAYGGRCAVTNSDAVWTLEAAHIVPYLGLQSNHVTNGLLLRSDIHTLFDLDLIRINPDSLHISCFDEGLVELVKGIGGIAAIAISHPHYYSTMVEWAEAFDCPVYLHAADRQWVMRPDSCIEFWDGETKSLPGGLNLIHCGGHFEGGTVLHWRERADGQGVLLTGDILQVVQDRRWLSFMYSYPNFIPLPAASVRQIVDAVEPFSFERIYGAFWGKVISTNAKVVVRRSAERYIEALNGH